MILNCTLIAILSYLFSFLLYRFAEFKEGHKTSFKDFNRWLITNFKEMITSKSVVRWQMDPILAQQLLELCRPYGNYFLEHSCGQMMHENVPCIYITFYQNRSNLLTEDDLLELKDLLFQHVYNYFQCRNVYMQMFVAHYKTGTKITYLIYYVEHSNDIENFKNRYSSYVLEQSPKNLKPLYDTVLEIKLESLRGDKNGQ